jgi:hypothetical protein
VRQSPTILFSIIDRANHIYKGTLDKASKSKAAVCIVYSNVIGAIRWVQLHAMINGLLIDVLLTFCGRAAVESVKRALSIFYPGNVCRTFDPVTVALFMNTMGLRQTVSSNSRTV